METKQKFKRGNLVKILVGHQIFSNEDGKIKTIDISPENVGREAIIEYSYAERYGGNDFKSYSVVFLDTGGSMSWQPENQMEFV
jgi:hypothetical protein